MQILTNIRNSHINDKQIKYRHERSDFAIAANETDFKSLVDELIKTSPEFREYWQQQEVHASCNGKISFKLSDILTESYQHTSLTVDEDKHLRLVVYLKD